MESLITVLHLHFSCNNSSKTEPARQNGCEDLLKKLDAKPNIDRLHAVVTEARSKKQAGYTGNDVWREDLHPSAAARAQIIPLLEEERERLKSQLAEVSAMNWYWQ